MIIPAFSEELGMRNEEFTAGHPHPIYINSKRGTRFPQFLIPNS